MEYENKKEWLCYISLDKYKNIYIEEKVCYQFYNGDLRATIIHEDSLNDSRNYFLIRAGLYLYKCPKKKDD